MATGQLTPTGRATVAVEIAGQNFEAVIDTGYEGGLQLPLDWLAILAPPVHARVTYQLGTGVIVTRDTYLVSFTMDGHTQTVETLFGDSDELLLGVDAMRDYRLVIDYPASTAALDRAP